MNPRIKRLLSMFLALTMVFSLLPVSASAASTTHLPSNKVEIEVGETATLKVSGIYSKTTWASSDDEIATVSSDGTVTGIAPGTATITATSKGFGFWGKTTTTKFTVIVTEPENREKVTVKVGEIYQLSITSSGGSVTWKSSDKNIAFVDANGLVTGVSEGDVIITATEKKVTGNPFFWWGGGRKTVITTTEFEVTVLPGDEQPSKPEESESPVATYTVTFESNGGTAVKSQVIAEGETVTEPETPTMEGYTFAGWYTDAELTTAYDFTTPVTSDITLYAAWKEEIDYYTVTFESNGGTAVESQVIAEGETATEPEAPTLEGYTFAGWYTDAELTAAYDFATPVTSDITLYAAWEDTETIYTVSFETNGGSEVVAQAIYAGQCAFQPADPTKEGYVFEDWYADEELTNSFDFTQPINADTIIYANWTELNVYISLDSGNYADNIVNRIVTGSITCNIAIERISYKLVSASSTTTEQIDLTEASGFSIDVLLEDGDNVLTVYVETADGSVASKSVTMTFDSGYVYDSGEVYDESSENLIKIPVWYGDDTSGDPDEYLVANILSLYFNAETSFDERTAFVTDVLGGKVVGYLNSMDMVQVLLPNPLPIPECVEYEGTSELTEITVDELYSYADALCMAYEELEFVDLEFIYNQELEEFATNDPWRGNDDDDWWLKKINAYDAWEYNNYYNCDFLTDFNLGVVDDGFQTNHVDLSGTIEVVSKEKSPDNHGTHVAGIMTAIADNEKGLAGVMYNNGKLIAYDAWKTSGSNSSSAILEGLTKAVEAGAKVINFSNGSSRSIPSGSYNASSSSINSGGRSASNKMAALLSKGYDFVVVQSAGNGNADHIGVDYWNNGNFCAINSENCVTKSATRSTKAVTENDIMSRILVVANLTSSGSLKFSSNGGSGELNIIAAPGTSIYSTINGNDYAVYDGTSMAAPIVTAVCGLTWSVNSYLTGAQVVDLVMNNTVGTAETNSTSHTTGGMGIVNALEAVEAAIESRTTYTVTVVDALNGNGISATIKIHTDSPDGPLVGSEQIYVSASDGSFTLPKLPSDVYWLEFSADGYVSNVVYANCWGSTDATEHLGTVALTPEMNENEYRILLHWTGEPRDLDSHLVATTIDGDSYHVYYSNKEPSPACANLDRDDVDYEGPETITITNFSDLRNIRYAVHDYTNRSSSNSTVLSNSGAYVDVYKGSTLVNTFYVPTNTGGTEWDVFAIDANGCIIATNQMTYCSNPSAVLNAVSTISISSEQSTVEAKPF